MSEPTPLMVPLLVTIKTAAPLRRAQEQALIERLAAAAARVEAGERPVMPIFHVFDDHPGHYPLALFVHAPDLLPPGRSKAMDELVHHVLDRITTEAGTGAAPVELEVATLSQDEVLTAGNTADRLYSPSEWTDRRAEADELKHLVDGPPSAPQGITADALYAALTALGRAPILPDAPADPDHPRLLGVLLAAVEQEIFLRVADGPGIVADIHHGYIAQLGGDRDGGTQLLAVLAARISLLTMLIDGNYGGPDNAGPILTSAGKAANATAGLLRLTTASRLGLHDDGTLRQMLRDVKKDLQAARQAYEDALRHLRKAGANI